MSIWLLPFLLIHQWLTILICARMCSLLVFHRALRCCLLLLSVSALVPHLCVFPAAVLWSASSMDFLISLYNSFPHLFLASLHFSHLPVNFCVLSFSTLYSLCLLCSFVFSSLSLTWWRPRGEMFSLFRSFLSFFHAVPYVMSIWLLPFLLLLMSNNEEKLLL